MKYITIAILAILMITATSGAIELYIVHDIGTLLVPVIVADAIIMAAIIYIIDSTAGDDSML